MQDVIRTAKHALVQVGAGVVAGSIIDAAFPSFVDYYLEAATGGYGIDILVLAAEVSLQVTADALLVGALLKMMATSSINNRDPALGFAFTLAIIESQPSLKAKIAGLGHLLRSQILDMTGLVEYKQPAIGSVTREHPNAVMPRGALAG